MYEPRFAGAEDLSTHKFDHGNDGLRRIRQHPIPMLDVFFGWIDTVPGQLDV